MSPIHYQNVNSVFTLMTILIKILSQVIEEPILMAIRSSQPFSLEIDESTDVSVSSRLEMHVRYTFIFFIRIT